MISCSFLNIYRELVIHRSPRSPPPVVAYDDDGGGDDDDDDDGGDGEHFDFI